MSIERNLRLALHQLVEAIEYTPMGVRGIKAIANARKALEAAHQPATPEPVGVNQLRKELSDANDFIQRLADLCVKYETLLGYRKTKAPEGASELAEARGESNVNTELDLAMPDSICDHVFVLDPKSIIRICNKCGTVECKKHTHPVPGVPALIEEAISSGHFGVLPMKATTIMCKAGWAASGGELTFQQIGHIYEEMYKVRPLSDAAMLAAKEGGAA